jgi:hypothetical protein
MLRNNKKEKKKRSWEIDEEEDDDTPSETFLKLQDELKERERLSKEKELEELARRQEEEAILKRAEEEASSNGNEGAKPCDTQDVHLEQAGGSLKVTICVSGYHNKTRIHELKQHFHQFGDLVEIVMRGNQAFLTFDREKDAEDAVLDGAAAPLNGRRLQVDFPTSTQIPVNGFHGGYR